MDGRPFSTVSTPVAATKCSSAKLAEIFHLKRIAEFENARFLKFRGSINIFAKKNHSMTFFGDHLKFEFIILVMGAKSLLTGILLSDSSLLSDSKTERKKKSTKLP